MLRALDEELLPGLKVLDYAEVAKVRIKKLKPVVRHVMNLVPDVSDTQIIATLKRAGMQFPRSRPRGSGVDAVTQFGHTGTSKILLSSCEEASV